LETKRQSGSLTHKFTEKRLLNLIILNYIMVKHQPGHDAQGCQEDPKLTGHSVSLSLLSINNVSWILGAIAGIACKSGLVFRNTDPLIVSFVLTGGIAFLLLMMWEMFRRVKMGL
jgi:hypothetical protein